MWQWLKRKDSSGCSRSREQVSTYLDGRLSERQKVEFEKHLADCAGCRKELESVRATVNLLQRVSLVPSPRSFTISEKAKVPVRVSLGLWRNAAATAAVLLVMVMAVDLSDILQTETLRYRQAAPAPAVEEMQPAFQTATTPSPGPVESAAKEQKAVARKAEGTPSVFSAAPSAPAAPAVGDMKGAEAPLPKPAPEPTAAAAAQAPKPAPALVVAATPAPPVTTPLPLSAATPSPPPPAAALSTTPSPQPVTAPLPAVKATPSPERISVPGPVVAATPSAEPAPAPVPAVAAAPSPSPAPEPEVTAAEKPAPSPGKPPEITGVPAYINWIRWTEYVLGALFLVLAGLFLFNWWKSRVAKR